MKDGIKVTLTLFSLIDAYKVMQIICYFIMVRVCVCVCVVHEIVVLSQWWS